MKLIRRHYEAVSAETALVEGEDRTLPSRVRAIVLVSKLHKPTLRALAFAKAARPSTLEALTVSVDAEETERLVQDLGGGQPRHPAQGGGLALPRGDQPDHRLRPQHPEREPAGRGHGLHPRIRGRALVGADPAQPERAAAEGPAAVHPRRDGDLGALPPRLLRPRRGADRAGDGPGERPPLAARLMRPKCDPDANSSAGDDVVIGPVEVGPIAHGGHCVARHEGRVIFVRHALPGERVMVTITDDSHDRFWRADAVRSSSPARTGCRPGARWPAPGSAAAATSSTSTSRRSAG